MGFEEKLKQYGVLVVGLLIGGGFAFMGIASYSGQVNTDSPTSGDTEFTAELPAQNYQEESFGMTQREQLIAAAKNDAVFVNAFYGTQSQLDDMGSLDSLPSEFNSRVYVQVVNVSSSSPLATSYNVEEAPSIIVVGSSRSSPAVRVESIDNSEVGDAVCQVMRDWGSVAAKCTVR